MKIFFDSILLSTADKLEDEFIRQIPYAASRSLNDNIYRISKRELPARADQDFHKGATRWTKSGFGFTKSTKRKLIAEIFTRVERPYLAMQIDGGTRIRPAGKSTIVTRAKSSKLTKHGNVSKARRRGYITKGKDHKRFFTGAPKGVRGARSDSYGVWERYGRNKKIRMVLSMQRTPMRYKKRFKFYNYVDMELADNSRGFAARFNRYISFNTM